MVLRIKAICKRFSFKLRVSKRGSDRVTQTPLHLKNATVVSEITYCCLLILSSPSGAVPTLTTTTMLENGTAVVVELPYIRALVDYNTWEFCQRKHEFRSMFAEWITQDLNGSV